MATDVYIRSYKVKNLMNQEEVIKVLSKKFDPRSIKLENKGDKWR